MGQGLELEGYFFLDPLVNENDKDAIEEREEKQPDMCWRKSPKRKRFTGYRLWKEGKNKT